MGVAGKRACYRLPLPLPCGGSLVPRSAFTRMCLLLGCCLCWLRWLAACLAALYAHVLSGSLFLCLVGVLGAAKRSTKHPSSALPTRGVTPSYAGTHPACRHPLRGYGRAVEIRFCRLALTAAPSFHPPRPLMQHQPNNHTNA